VSAPDLDGIGVHPRGEQTFPLGLPDPELFGEVIGVVGGVDVCRAHDGPA
jgi:hypothetical protein